MNDICELLRGCPGQQQILVYPTELECKTTCGMTLPEEPGVEPETPVMCPYDGLSPQEAAHASYPAWLDDLALADGVFTAYVGYSK